MSLETLLEAAHFIEVDQDDYARVSPSDSNDGSTGKREFGRGFRGKRIPTPTTSTATRALHNKLEKNRRAQLKHLFNHLNDEVPTLRSRKASNLLILRNATKYIGALKRKEKEMENETQRLVRQKIMYQEKISQLKSEIAVIHGDIDLAPFLKMEQEADDNQSVSTDTADEEMLMSEDEAPHDSSSTLSTSSVNQMVNASPGNSSTISAPFLGYDVVSPQIQSPTLVITSSSAPPAAVQEVTLSNSNSSMSTLMQGFSSNVSQSFQEPRTSSGSNPPTIRSLLTPTKAQRKEPPQASSGRQSVNQLIQQMALNKQQVKKEETQRASTQQQLHQSQQQQQPLDILAQWSTILQSLNSNPTSVQTLLASDPKLNVAAPEDLKHSLSLATIASTVTQLPVTNTANSTLSRSVSAGNIRTSTVSTSNKSGPMTLKQLLPSLAVTKNTTATFQQSNLMQALQGPPQALPAQAIVVSTPTSILPLLLETKTANQEAPLRTLAPKTTSSTNSPAPAVRSLQANLATAAASATAVPITAGSARVTSATAVPMLNTGALGGGAQVLNSAGQVINMANLQQLLPMLQATLQLQQQQQQQQGRPVGTSNILQTPTASTGQMLLNTSNLPINSTTPQVILNPGNIQSANSTTQQVLLNPGNIQSANSTTQQVLLNPGNFQSVSLSPTSPGVTVSNNASGVQLLQTAGGNLGALNLSSLPINDILSLATPVQLGGLGAQIVTLAPQQNTTKSTAQTAQGINLNIGQILSLTPEQTQTLTQGNQSQQSITVNQPITLKQALTLGQSPSKNVGQVASGSGSLAPLTQLVLVDSVNSGQQNHAKVTIKQNNTRTMPS